jgi:hypothetical protein
VSGSIGEGRQRVKDVAAEAVHRGRASAGMGRASRPRLGVLQRPFHLDCLGNPRFSLVKRRKQGWKSLDFLGFSRPNRAFSMGYEGRSGRNILRSAARRNCEGKAARAAAGARGSALKRGAVFSHRNTNTTISVFLQLLPIGAAASNQRWRGIGRFAGVPRLNAAWRRPCPCREPIFETILYTAHQTHPRNTSRLGPD